MITTLIAGLISRLVADRYPISENVEVYLPSYNVWAKDHNEPTYTAISEDNIPDMDLSDLIKVFAAAIADEAEGEYLSSDNEVLTEEEVAERMTNKAFFFVSYALGHRDENEEYDKLYKVFLKKAIADGINQL